MENRFCSVDLWSRNMPKWSSTDFLLWKIHINYEGGRWDLSTGEPRLFGYKIAYPQYNKDKIIKYAEKEKIPVLLLAGVYWSEAAGVPDYVKSLGVLPFRMILGFIGKSGKKPNATSVGIGAMQIGVAAKTLGLDPGQLTTTDQLLLAKCLMEDDFNIRIVAKHLKDLILYDNSEITDTSKLTDEQFIIAASRYNRGIERKKEDFIRSINASPGEPIRDYSSYGRAIIRRREQIYKALGVSK